MATILNKHYSNLAELGDGLGVFLKKNVSFLYGPECMLHFNDIQKEITSVTFHRSYKPSYLDFKWIQARKVKETSCFKMGSQDIFHEKAHEHTETPEL